MDPMVLLVVTLAGKIFAAEFPISLPDVPILDTDPATITHSDICHTNPLTVVTARPVSHRHPYVRVTAGVNRTARTTNKLHISSKPRHYPQTQTDGRTDGPLFASLREKYPLCFTRIPL